MRTSWAASIFAVVILQLLETGHCQAYISGPFVKPRRHARGLGLSSKTLQVGEKRTGHQSVIGVTRFKGTRHLQLTLTEYCDEGEFEERMQLLTRVLEQDLPLQYEKPQDLSCFSGGIEFDDPVTSLRGKLLYRGMLFFTMLFFRVACQPGSYFTVTSIDRPAREIIRTVWETGAVTRWNGRDIFISGVDTFSVNNKGRIWRHDSAWDQTWEEVKQQVV